MPRAQSTRVKLTTAAIFILLEVAAVAMLRSSSSLQNIWINRASHRVIGAIWGSGENIRSYFSLRKQNEELAEENNLLLEELRRYRAMEEVVLMDQLSGAPRRDFIYTPAKVVKMSRAYQHNYVILDKGSADGVKPNTGIITSNGVVGIVQAVDEHFSYGMTLMNTEMTVSARIGRRGIVAPLQWDGRHSDKALLKGIALDYPVNPGDTIWTSGHSALYPSDIPIGTALQKHAVNGATENIEISLLQDFSSLKYVTIVERIEAQKVKELEDSRKPKKK